MMNAVRSARRNHFRLWSVIAASVVTIGSMSQCFAFEDSTTSNDEKAEICVEKVREAPAIPYGKIGIDGRRVASRDPGQKATDGEIFTGFKIPGKDVSQAFSDCIKAAGRSKNFFSMVDNFRYGKRVGDAELIERIQSEGDSAPRYVFIDAYERKYILDLQDKRSYDLVRIPVPGSIESKGHWDGEYNPGPTCLNSNGDPCGTKYTLGRTGWNK